MLVGIALHAFLQTVKVFVTLDADEGAEANLHSKSPSMQKMSCNLSWQQVCILFKHLENSTFGEQFC